MWIKIKDDELVSKRHQGIEVVEGIPCPWCDQLIEEVWTKHVFVADELYCSCPHCNRNFRMKPGSDK